MPRRSPRNHSTASSSTVHIPSGFRGKPAVIEWSDVSEGSTSSPDQDLVTAIENNRRWRWGFFRARTAGTQRSPTAQRTLMRERAGYCYEIARALFLAHPQYNERYDKKPTSFAKAVQERIESLPTRMLNTMLPKRPQTRRSIKAVSKDIGDFQLSEAGIWMRYRKSQSPAWESASWKPKLPLELQFMVVRELIRPDDPNETSFLNYQEAAKACLVNNSWYREIAKQLYSTVIISRPAQYASVYAPHGVMFKGGAGENTSILRLTTPPHFTIQLCVHCAHVPQVQYDFGSSRVFFDFVDPTTGHLVRDLDRPTTRISALASLSIPLYHIILNLHAKTLRLYCSSQFPIDFDDNTWQDLMAGHVAALRMMTRLEHLILDADLYLILLPSYKAWFSSDGWRQILVALKHELMAAPRRMSTFFDETPLTELTLVGEHVPILAFLALISRAPRVRKINLVGWDKPTMPKEWKEFVEIEGARPDPLYNWVKGDLPLDTVFD